MKKSHLFGAACACFMYLYQFNAQAAILGSHAFTWWDTAAAGGGVVVTPLGAPAPAPGASRLLDLREWHLDQAQTTQWYNGGNVAGLPTNPFNAANRTGVTAGSVINPVAGAEAFIYELTNINYGSGNVDPVTGGPFSFTNLPAAGNNELSGINIIDNHGSLNIAPPLPGSQFMFTDHIPQGFGAILDLTPASVLGAFQDWDFNAFSGAGNFEWDIQNPAGGGNPPGIFSALAQGLPGVFGFAMPGNWFDSVNDGWVHSWDALPSQVNLANSVGGFSGPAPIPVPAAVWLFISGFLGLIGIARRKKAA